MLEIVGHAGVFVLLGAVVMAAHEATHFAVAFLVGEPSFRMRSWLPVRIDVTFDAETLWVPGIRLMALAPTLCGCLIAVLILLSGRWPAQGLLAPPSLKYIALLYWLLYTLPSPADCRSCISPHHHLHGQETGEVDTDG